LRLPAEGEWIVRVVPNLYPAVERQEVVIHSPRHVRSFAELTEEEVALVAQVVAEAGAFWLVNEGRAAGSSLPHSHSQLAFVDPVYAENAAGVREVLARGDLLVTERDGARAVAHPAGRLAYELLLDAERVEPALMLLRECISRLRAVEGPIPWNAWLHRGEAPHIEVVPRLTVMAGLELGAGIYVNSLDPAEAAARLRGVSPPTPARPPDRAGA
jgi:UDPglucose--hexose-1-phosphate uridylyltransferase